MQPLSVPEIIREHPRDALFVQPILWTARHLGAFSVSFKETVREQEAPDGGNEDLLADMRPVGFSTHAAEMLATSQHKTAAFVHLLGQEFNGPLMMDHEFSYFYYRSTYRISVPTINFTFAVRYTASLLPNGCDIALLYTRDIERMRNNLYGNLKRGFTYKDSKGHQRDNEPLKRIRQFRLKNLQPSSSDRDPYIVAVLLVLAQTHAKADVARARFSKDRIFKTGVFLVSEDQENIRLFTANIHVAYLSTFEYPRDLEPSQRQKVASAESLEPASLTVDCQKIPYKPYHSLRERLLDAIKPLEPTGFPRYGPLY